MRPLFIVAFCFSLKACSALEKKGPQEKQKTDYFPSSPTMEPRPPTPEQLKARHGLTQVSFKGFRFKDNKSKYRWEEGINGMATLTFDTFVPPSMTLCLRGRVLYNRHGDYSYWFNLIINNKKPRVGTLPVYFSLYQRSIGDWGTRSYSVLPPQRVVMNKKQLKEEESERWPFRNNLRKWTHVCVVGDFANDKIVLFINGEKINEEVLLFSKLFPDDYYSEAHRSSSKILSGFSFEFGRFLFDKNPIIGELMDINAWDYILDEEDMKAITNCKMLKPTVGNMINMTSAFNLTGPLCQPIQLDSEELGCADTNKERLQKGLIWI